MRDSRASHQSCNDISTAFEEGFDAAAISHTAKMASTMALRVLHAELDKAQKYGEPENEWTRKAILRDNTNFLRQCR